MDREKGRERKIVLLYLPCVAAESSSSPADRPTTLPFCQTWISKPKRACSSTTSSTASLNAISARFSSGNLRTCLGALFIGSPVVLNQSLVILFIHYMKLVRLLPSDYKRRADQIIK